MNSDPGLICFEHCNCDIFSFSVPKLCPICNLNLSQIPSSIMPFRVPYPFARASQHPCSIVLKPTHGDFLCAYKNSQDLHIGLTDSHGTVHAFDEHGLQIGNDHEWEQCLTISGLSHTQPCLMEEEWDAILEEMLKRSHWNPERYEENGFNCYSFVLEFLQSLNCGTLSKFSHDKETFCKKVLIPQTTSAAKYISVFRRVSSKDIFVQPKGKTTK